MKNLIYENFQKSFKDLEKIKIHFLFSLVIFLFMVFIGLILPIFFEEQILKMLEELLKLTEGLGFFSLTGFIIFNNIKSAFLGMIFGIFLAVVPLIVIIVNGYILGFVANKSIAIDGVLVLLRLFPHGIFEIPAVLISVSLGIKLGIDLMINYLNYKKIDRVNIPIIVFLSILFFPIAILVYLIFTFSNQKLRRIFFDNFIFSLRIFLFIVVPLLIIAGIIEGGLIVFLG